MLPSDPDRELLYDRFVDLFYNRAFAGEPINGTLFHMEGQTTQE